MGFIINNIATIIVGLIVLAIVTLVVIKMVKDKKKGIGTCGSKCANCPNSGMCK